MITTGRVRRGQPTARVTSVCGAQDCQSLIEPGYRVVRTPAGSWRHADCSAPARQRGRRKARTQP